MPLGRSDLDEVIKVEPQDGIIALTRRNINASFFPFLPCDAVLEVISLFHLFLLMQVPVGYLF